MPATIIMGEQWGDEGKGKLTDALAAQAHFVVRPNGGSNAGHTVEVGDQVYKFHLVPSGILNPDCICVIGAGTVIDPLALLREMDQLQTRGIDLKNLRISDRAHLILPYHPALDRAEEARREEDGIGTTLTGNGPAYADKVARRGIRMADLTDSASLLSILRREVDHKNQILGAVYGQPLFEVDELYQSLAAAGARLREYIAPVEVEVLDGLSAGKEILVECAQGAMLDIDYGTYPFVTSSSPTAAGACQGAGIPPHPGPPRHRRLQGLCDAGRQRTLPHGAPRRDRPAHTGTWPRVRHDHRPSPPHRLVRRRRRPSHDSPQRRHGNRPHLAGCP